MSKRENIRTFLLPVLCASLLMIGYSACSHKVVEITPDLAFKAEATTGEGSIWHPGRKSLFWVDIEGRTLYEFHPEKDDCSTWSFDRMVSTVVPESDTTVVVTLQNAVVRLNLATGAKTTLVKINDHKGTLRFNDGKCSPSGHLWAGTMAFDQKKGAATLYCIHPNGKIDAMLKGVTNSNGLVWSSDKRFMYYNDTPTGRIQRFRYDERSDDILLDGIAVRIPKGTGSPDGMTIDNNDNLWVAQWGGFGVYCYNPYTGELLAKVEVPAPNVASCAFGGENLDILYITTACAGLSEKDLEKYPLSGSVFACKPGAVGVPANYFGANKVPAKKPLKTN